MEAQGTGIHTDGYQDAHGPFSARCAAPGAEPAAYLGLGSAALLERVQHARRVVLLEHLGRVANEEAEHLIHQG